MCGISGYYCFGKKRPTFTEVTGMLKEIENRGGDATGFALIGDNDKIQVSKGPVDSDKFIESTSFKKLAKELPRTLIMHTRKWTQGDPKDNKNNHPIWISKKRLALIHNGGIPNDEDVFENLKLDRQAEVDSEVLAQIFAKEKTFKKGVKAIADSCTGRVAFAMLREDSPDKLYLGKSKNPVELLLDTERDILFFASNVSSVRKAYQVERKVAKWRGFPLPKIKSFEQPSMAMDTAMIMGPTGIEECVDFNMTMYNPYKKAPPVKNYRMRALTGKNSGFTVVRTNSWDMIKARTWDGLNNGTQVGICSECQGVSKPVKYIHKAEVMLCKCCYSSSEIIEDEVEVSRCDKCLAFHAHVSLTEEIIYDPTTNFGTRMYFCEECLAEVKALQCEICGQYEDITRTNVAPLGYICDFCEKKYKEV